MLYGEDEAPIESCVCLARRGWITLSAVCRPGKLRAAILSYFPAFGVGVPYKRDALAAERIIRFYHRVL